MAKSREKESEERKTYTIFQRLRDASLRNQGIQLSDDELDELMGRMGQAILDQARADDSRIFERVGGDSLRAYPDPETGEKVVMVGGNDE